VKDAAQALGLRPWLAALPLRERRLRARLLMLCSKMGLSVILGRPRSPPLWHIIEAGSDLALGEGRACQQAEQLSRCGGESPEACRALPTANQRKSTQVDGSGSNTHAVFTLAKV
jgi:hypothetical protein